MLASLLCCDGRFSSDYTDYKKNEKTQEEESSAAPTPSPPKPKGNLGGLEDRASHNGNRAVGRVDYPQDSDKKGLSTLFESIKSGLGAGSPEDEQQLAGGAVGGTAPVAGGGVVHRVSCRRRRDSNSSSNSDSDEEVGRSPSRREHVSSLETNGTGRKGYVPRYAQSQTESAPNSIENISGGGSDSRLNSLSLSSDASVSTVKEGQIVKVKDLQGGEGQQRGDRDGRGVTPQAHPRNGRRMLPQVGVKPPRMLDTVDGQKDEDQPSSGCSYTSSEWGDVTPTDHPEGISAQSSVDRKEEAGSGLAQSSGYVSASRRNGDEPEPEPAPRKKQQRRSGTVLPPEHAQQSSQPADAQEVKHEQPKTAALDQLAPAHQGPSGDRHSHPVGSAKGGTQTHVRRQSSGVSDSMSLSSARTASPATKMRLLDMASNRAMERDGDSVKSWSAGSDDTLSLGMSCSGMRGSPEVPASLTQKVHYGKKSKGGNPEAADNFQIPHITRSRLSDGDHASGSDLSAQGSPDKRGSSQHLSVPSHTGSLDERSSVDEDENIDELFAKHRMRSSLGVSRSSLGDSRESLASVYSDAGEINYGRIPVTGNIVFGLDYDHKRSALVISIKCCEDLAPVDTKHNRSDPYVKVYLLPDKTRSGKRKSKIKKHTLNPVYNETLTYNISSGELQNRTLWVTVWHSDRFGRNDFLGEVLIPMDTYRFDDPSPNRYALQSRMPEMVNEEAMQYKGELIVSVRYVTPDQASGDKKSKSKSKKTKTAAERKGEIHVMIKSAKNLTAVRSSGASDPFVKGYLLPDRTRTGKQKTPVVKNSVNPMWNHIFTFDGIDQEELPERCLELTVWDHEKLGTNEFLGGARLNLGHGAVDGHQVEWMDARGEEAIAWQNMIDSPNTWVDARLPLRASMGKPSKK
nr:hypothetical protein BaRGS_004746 [Batillaria attramentaria]